MAINKLGSGGFNHLGAPLGNASTPNFSLIWSPAYLAWGGAYLTWS